jgi:hypothetical protein
MSAFRASELDAPGGIGVVHPVRALIRELPARLLCPLARFTPLCLGAPFRVTAHDRRLYPQRRSTDFPSITARSD